MLTTILVKIGNCFHFRNGYVCNTCEKRIVYGVPEPTTNMITISGIPYKQNYEVITLQGKVIKKGTADSETISIDLSGQKMAFT
jgi:hypothetical protein